MSNNKKTIRKLLGIVALLMAGFGLYYNSQTAYVAITGGFEGIHPDGNPKYFYLIFAVMSTICVLCYLLLSWLGIRLLLGRTFRGQVFNGLMIFEVLYFLCLGPLWLTPVIGRSIAASTGVATGGLMAQFLILFPIWAPFLLWWTERSPINATKAEQDVPPNT